MSSLVFELNRHCLVQIPRIIKLLRGQEYFKGSRMTALLIPQLSKVSEEIMSRKEAQFDKQEWLSILQAVMSAQENRDYILIADILEGDLQQYLQKFQVMLQTEGEFKIPEYWDDNMNCLKTTHEELYCELLQKDEQRNNFGQEKTVAYELMLGVNGQLTLKATVAEKTFCLHSTVNPQWEAEMLAESVLQREVHEYWIFGIGLGYHVRAILESDEDNKVTVLESDLEVLGMTLTYFEWREYLTSGRLCIVYEKDVLRLMQRLKEKQPETVFFVHYPSLQCIRNSQIKERLEDYFISVSSMQEQGNLLDKNFAEIRKHQLPECESLKHIFNGKRLVIVGGGPSVDAEMDNIRKYRERISLILVGTVARKFLQEGICPDAIVISDPQKHMYQQIEGLQTKDIPLILLSTASSTILPSYEGPIYIAYQEGYGAAEQMARENGYTLFATGGSVSTLAIDIAIRLKANEIILVGMDMAYTDNQSHAGGIGYEISDKSNLRLVRSVDENYVYTSRNLDVYRKWIERRIEGLAQPIIYNTGRGARIAGTVELGFSELF